MTRKITALSDYITAAHAAHLLSLKLGRPIDPHYIHRLKNVRWYRLNRTTKLYHRVDVQAAHIRQRGVAESSVTAQGEMGK
jgi:hypothetical protein